jgi:hypothetical protein
LYLKLPELVISEYVLPSATYVRGIETALLKSYLLVENLISELTPEGTCA